jgi:hypothetical protein
MLLYRHQKFHKILIETIVIIMAILLLVYPLEGMARSPLVRIHHGDSSSSYHNSVSESYEASRQSRARRDARVNVQNAENSLQRASSHESRIQSEGASGQSPNTHYRDLMDAQGERYRAESDLREAQSRAYWENRR